MDIGGIDCTLPDKPVGYSICQPICEHGSPTCKPSTRSRIRNSELVVAEAKENVVFLDDKEIKVADLTDEQKYYHSQIVDLRNQKARINFQLDQLMPSLNFYEDAFIKSTKEKAEEVLAVDND